MCVSINFTSLFRSLLNACHPPSPLLFSVPLVSIRLTRLWTILCPVFVVLGQPALRAARKSHVHSSHTVHICALLVLPHNSQLHLSLPLCHSRLLVLVHSASRAAVVLDGEHLRSGRISMHPAGLLGRWVFYILAVPASPYFHVGNTNISVGSGGADTYK